MLSARTSTAGSSSGGASNAPSNGKGIGWLARLCGEVSGGSGLSSAGGEGRSDKGTAAKKLAGLQAAVKDLRDKLQEDGGKVGCSCHVPSPMRVPCPSGASSGA